MECTFEAFWVRSTLGSSNGGVCGSNLEEDGSLFVGNGRLSDLLGREGVLPRKVDLNLGEA
jgi:hypothetical protein